SCDEPRDAEERDVRADPESERPAQRRQPLVDEPHQRECREERHRQLARVGGGERADADALGRRREDPLRGRGRSRRRWGLDRRHISVADPERERATIVDASAFTASVTANNVRPAAIRALKPMPDADSPNLSAMSDAIELPPAGRTCTRWEIL